MRALFEDLRYALRMLRKTPGSTLAIIASLAIGIGANSAIFSVVDALLLRPLPYPQPRRLAAIWLHSPGLGIFRDWPSPGQFIDLRSENHSFEEMALAQSRTATLLGLEQPERVNYLKTQSTLFHMLGAQPLLGRLLRPDEDKPGKPAVAILSYGVWRRLFSSDPNIVGRSINLDGAAYAVAGVLGPKFMLNSEVMPSEEPMDRMDIFLPLPLGADAGQRRHDENYNILARLKPGVTIRQAQADVDVIAARIREKDKRDRTFGMDVVGLQQQVVGDVRRVLLVLLGSVGLVLLIACANVANLLLTRATRREKELAIRGALGAGWMQLIRQLMVESVLLAGLGGAAGLLIAKWSLDVVRTINPGNIPRLEDIRINGTVLGFTLAITLLTGLVSGIAPVWRAIKVDLNTSLKAGGRSGQGDGGLRFARHRFRGLLVISEVAFSVMLLVGAGLLIRSFIRLQGVPPGFTTDRVLSMQISANGPKYRGDAPIARFFEEVERRVARLPGVKSEGFANIVPLTGMVGWGGINVEGYLPPPGQELQVDLRLASAGYFPTMKIPLIAGRFFSRFDTADSQQVVVIDKAFADRFWPHSNPIGKHLWFDPKKPFTIVGVVGTVKQYGLDAASKIVTYFPAEQHPTTVVYLVAHTAGDPAALSGAIIHEIHAVDPTILVSDVRTMQDRLYRSLARPRFASVMLGAFAGFALLLAAVGVYGVMSFLVGQSTHDIGVRVALGARPGDILGLVMRQGMTLAAAGMLVGLAGAAMLTRVMASLLFGVSADDLATFAAVTALLGIAALAATVIPARRASCVDPIVALREE
jgi:putative ABC transport system permease protein